MANENLQAPLNTDLNVNPMLRQEQKTAEQAVQSKLEAQQLGQQVGAEEKSKALSGIAEKGREQYDRYETEKAKYPAPEFHPTQDNAMDLGSLFSMVATMGVALGGSGKLSSLNALNSMGGMLKGWQSGRKDLYERELKNFDKEMTRIKQIREDLQKDLENYQKLQVTDKEAALAKAEEIAVKHPGVIAANIRAGKADVAATIAKRMTDFEEKQVELKMRAESNLIAKQQMMLMSGGAAAEIYKRTGVFIKNPKEVGEVTSYAQGLRGIEDLQKRMQDPEIELGVKGKIAPFLEKLASVDQNTDPAAVVNATLTATDKTTVFLKDALLASYDIERAAQGGRLTVDMVKRTTPVLDPTNYTKEAYNTILDGRRINLYQRLQSSGIDYNAAQNLVNQPAVPGAAPAVTSSETGKDEKGTYHWEYSPDKTQRRKVYE
jgi:hypothetical protein